MVSPFQTPPNEKSFSSLVDDAILATGKPGSFISAVQAVNLTVRECQSFGLFARDLIEATIMPDVSPYIWTRPAYFRKIRTVKYVNTCVYPKFLLPGRAQKDECEYFYAADDYYVFKGVATTDTIAYAAYFWAMPLNYYAAKDVDTAIFPGGPYTTRLAYFDLETMVWMYWTGVTYATTTGSTVTDASYRALSSNWLIQDWYSLILSGTKAKIWAQTGDQRGVVEYSTYKQTQTLLRNTVGYEAEGF